MSDALDAVDWPVHTERLLIRRGVPDDLDPTWEYRRLPEVNDWLGAATVDYAEYRERLLDQTRLAVTLVVEVAGRIVGDLMLRIGDGWAQAEVAEQAKGVEAELGWSFHPAAGGRGYATEAVAASVDLCFGPLGLRRVTATCFADNERSWRLMERLGMRREAHNRQDSLHWRRGWLDGYVYALLADEWPRSGQH